MVGSTEFLNLDQKPSLSERFKIGREKLNLGTINDIYPGEFKVTTPSGDNVWTPCLYRRLRYDKLEEAENRQYYIDDIVADLRFLVRWGGEVSPRALHDQIIAYGDTYWIIIERKGKSLDLLPNDSLIRNRNWLRVHPALQLADHIFNLHQNHWAHRDLKGPNVLLDESGHVWLIDPMHRTSNAKDPVGTVKYWPYVLFRSIGTREFEKLTDSQEFTLAMQMDINAYFVMLYEQLTGKDFLSGEQTPQACYTRLSEIARNHNLIPNELKAAGVSPELASLVGDNLRAATMGASDSETFLEVATEIANHLV